MRRITGPYSAAERRCSAAERRCSAAERQCSAAERQCSAAERQCSAAAAPRIHVLGRAYGADLPQDNDKSGAQRRPST